MNFTRRVLPPRGCLLRTSQRNRISLDWDDAWRLDTGGSDHLDCEVIDVSVLFAARIPLRPVRLIADGFGISHLLLGFAEPDTFVGATMTDTGRGTFTLTGRPVIDRATLDQLDLAPGETAIEVPKCERKFYGAPAGR
ncbi:DUF1062 domain-containing protein [Nocardia salmonicida]|uniref:DUF1062 domain-containing protein n=1 Tax=Nocardia salmonicida TaxID=53431 RepID=UPI00342F8D6B